MEYYKDNHITIYLADCRDILPLLSDIDAVITDPPYGLGFMNKEWDNPDKERELIERERRRSEQRFKEGKSPTTAPFSQSIRPGLPIKGAREGKWFQEWCYQWASECLRVLKPGGYLLCFGATRTYHRMACAIEDAGFEIRDMINWVYGSGFPKSLNVGKAMDKLQGNERDVIGTKQHAKKDFKDNLYAQDPANRNNEKVFGYGEEELTKGNSEWEGWGTALKPAHEPIVLARKPLSEKTVAENVLKYGTGAINIDGCRVGTAEISVHNAPKGTFAGGELNRGSDTSSYRSHQGRFPANLIHDGSDEVLAELGEPARFFYCAKASRTERDAGLDDLPDSIGGGMQGTLDQKLLTGSGNIRNNKMKNNHPTVKPLALMRYLIKLITPPNGIILDPFMGSGSTLIAVKQLGFKAIGIELEEKYCEIAKKRLSQSIMRLV